MAAKILVVDDSASDRAIITGMLEDYQLLTACDGIEAMQMLKQHEDINLMILDLNMPNMDGFEVLEQLQADNRLSKLRTIILTNYNELENEMKGLRMGAWTMCASPFIWSRCGQGSKCMLNCCAFSSLWSNDPKTSWRPWRLSSPRLPSSSLSVLARSPAEPGKGSA